jgi:hypothetical protein
MIKSCEELNLAQTSFVLFCGTSIPIGLGCLLLMFKTIHFLIKFVHHYVVVIKVCQGQLYGLYNDINTYFVLYGFKDFKDLLDYKHKMVSLSWIVLELDLNMVRVECLTFQCVKQNFDATYLDCVIRKLGLVIKKTYVIFLEEVKELCKDKFPII